MKRPGNALRQLPPAAVIKVLRKTLTMPAGPARLFFNDVLRPEKWHRKYIYKVRGNPQWWGAWIGENVSKLTEEALMKRIENADIIFFNVHGGGFRIGKCTMFMDTYIQWINCLKAKYNLNVMIMSVEHRLAPEFKYPSPVEDVVHAYEYLVNTLQVDMSKVIAVGDCSGAGILLEMLFLTHDPSMFEIVTDDPNVQPGDLVSELPRPAGLVISSPLATEETDTPSWKENVKYDYISQQTAKIVIRDFFEPPTPDRPEGTQVLGVTKLQTGFEAFLPPTLMFIGSKEVVRDHALDMASKAQDDGVPWQTVMEDYVHDWFCVREVVKDKSVLKRADDTFAQFCYRHAVARRNSQAMEGVAFINRPSKGLSSVPEDDEQEDASSSISNDQFYESMTTTEELESILTSISEFSIHSKAGTQKSDTILV